jgi:hypothetical protein
MVWGNLEADRSSTDPFIYGQSKVNMHPEDELS